MRIAHFVHRYPPALGGAESYFARLSRDLTQADHEVTVFTSNAFDLEAFWSRRGRCLPSATTFEDGVRVRRYPLVRWPGRRYVLKALSWVPHKLWKCLTLPCNPISLSMWREAGKAETPFDVVHASAFPYAWPIACGRRLARRQRIPFAVTPFLHLGDPDDADDPTRRAYTTPALLSLLQAADRIFVQTEGERDELIRRNISADKLVLQGLGVDPKECTGGNRERAHRQWQVQPGETVIGHLANNSREKGTIDLVLALAQLWRQGLPVRLVLAGPEMPTFKRFWQSFARDYPGAPIIRTGPLSDEQRRDFFAGIDVFALPSRSDSFGLVLLEAWANGVANVAYDSGGIRDVIRHASDGLLVRCGQLDALASAVAHLHEDPDLRRRLGNVGQDRLSRDFAWNDKLDLVREVCETLCANTRPAISSSCSLAES